MLTREDQRDSTPGGGSTAEPALTAPSRGARTAGAPGPHHLDCLQPETRPEARGTVDPPGHSEQVRENQPRIRRAGKLTEKSAFTRNFLGWFESSWGNHATDGRSVFRALHPRPPGHRHVTFGNVSTPPALSLSPSKEKQDTK